MLCKHPRKHIPNYKRVELVWRTQNVDHIMCVLGKKPTDNWFQKAPTRENVGVISIKEQKGKGKR